MTDAAAPFPLSGQRVLITGGLGFIGSNLAHRCLSLGAQVTVYDCLDPRSGGNMRNLHGIESAVRIVLNDVRNFEGVCAVIRDHDLVFNCAAYTSHPNSMRDPLTDIDINCKGVINLLEAARRFNPAIRLVQVATSTQIGRMRYSPVDENHPEFPLDIYSANKSVSEKYALIYGNAYGLPVAVVRLPNVFGPRSNIISPEFGAINYFVGLALQGRPLTVYGEGAQMRNVLFVEDAVSALLAATGPTAQGQVFFAAGDGQHSIGEIARAIVAAMGQGEVRHVAWPKERAAIEFGDVILSNAKIKAALGWSLLFSLEAGLAVTRAYFERHLEHYLRGL